jgi:hypothetical protein
MSKGKVRRNIGKKKLQDKNKGIETKGGLKERKQKGNKN